MVFYSRYLLHEDAKIVISDVDGTVTKEDVMGHVMYALHQDYTQKGIVRMYNRIDENGYVILYLDSTCCRSDEGYEEVFGGN